MKKLGLFLMFFLPLTAQGQTLNGMNDAQQLGAMAGLALACNAGNRLDDFQLIASYIIANESATDAARKKAFNQYAEEKLRTYNLQRNMPKDDCKNILDTFYSLPIFGSTVYADGTVKFPDGKILKPKTVQEKAKAQRAAQKKAKEPKRNYMTPPRNS